MKKIFTLLVLFSTIVLFSFIEYQTKSLQNVKQKPDHHMKLTEDVQFVQDAIVIKLKNGFGDYSRMTGNIATGISSLDSKFVLFKASKFDKRFVFKKSNIRDRVPDLSRIYVVNFASGLDIHRAVRAFSSDPAVEYAEPIPINMKCEVPDDEMYGSQWHLPHIKAPEAWDIHKGEDGPEVLIAIVDDAVEWRHEDLIDNVWQNLGEDADGDGHVIEFDGSDWIFDPDDENGIDDDGNGYVDDFVGWDFINTEGEEDNDPTPEYSSEDHGTHCIGIANATTNNATDVAGAAWNVKFLTCKGSNSPGLSLEGDLYQAIIYCAEHGADVITNSWSGIYPSQSNKEAVLYARSLGSIVVAAASNDDNAELHYPASYPTVISVAATSNDDQKASFSNYGVAIDVCSPGVQIMSLTTNDGTKYKDGTSMATPLVAGQIALMQSYYPDWTPEEIVYQLLATADEVNSVNPDYEYQLGYGRINAYRALTEENPTIQQKLWVELSDYLLEDTDGDNIFSPGDTVYLNFEITNYSVGLGEIEVPFKIHSASENIDIIDSLFIGAIQSDGISYLENAFAIKIRNTVDSAKAASLVLSIDSDMAIPMYNDWVIDMIVNQQGVIVFHGIGLGINAYSGTYFRDYFTDLGYPVYYTRYFPRALNGFDAAFICLGNYGATLTQGTMYTPGELKAVENYIESGGNVFVESGSFFGYQYYFEWPEVDYTESLFGVDSTGTQLTFNSIDSLAGLPGSIAEGFVFTGSSQTPNYYIDTLVPNQYGIPLFYESDYGIVGMQSEGEFGQKTILMSYAMQFFDSTELRDELMNKVAQYFGLWPEDIHEISNVDNEFTVTNYPNPFSEYTNITVENATCNPPEADFVSPEARLNLQPATYNIEIFDLTGRLIKSLGYGTLSPGPIQVTWNAVDQNPGIYLCLVQVGDQIQVIKLVKQ